MFTFDYDNTNIGSSNNRMKEERESSEIKRNIGYWVETFIDDDSSGYWRYIDLDYLINLGVND